MHIIQFETRRIDTIPKQYAHTTIIKTISNIKVKVHIILCTGTHHMHIQYKSTQQMHALTRFGEVLSRLPPA